MSRGACVRGLRLTLGVLLCSSRVWAQAAEPLPPPPAAPPGDDADVPAAPPTTVPPTTVPPTLSTPPPVTPARSSPRPAPGDADRDWYGWQFMISDVVALGSIGGAAIAGVHGNVALAVVIPAAVVYDLSGPTVHWLHHRRSIAAASLGVRIGVPFIGVFVGMAVAPCSNGTSSDSTSCRSRGGGYGALGGFAAATALDAALFAWDAPKSESVRTGLAWAPTFTPLQRGAAAGVVGTF